MAWLRCPACERRGRRCGLTYAGVVVNMKKNQLLLLQHFGWQMSRRSSQGASGGSSADFVSVAPPPVIGQLSVNSSSMVIKSVQMVNFMMSDDVVVDFGDRLNFICGPNGSGKSTVLCAILIGLCGDTKNLGRASAEKTFIKSGKDFLKLKVTLAYTSGSHNDVEVSRRITQTASTSSIDGRKLSKEDVLEWVQKQNIQFDNLCHFMAQTRVRLFAQLAQKPKEFLLQVEEAVGPPGQAELHRWLISQNSEKQIAEKNKEQLQLDLERLKERQRLLDIEMQRYQSLIDIQKQQESAEDFRPHLLANTEQQRFDEKVLQMEPLKQEAAEKERSLQGARNAVAQKRSDMSRASKAVEEAGKSIQKLKDDSTKKCSDAVSYAKKVDSAREELEAAQREVEDHHATRQNCNDEVEKAKDALARTTSKLDELRRTGNFEHMQRDKKAISNELQKLANELDDSKERKLQLQQDLNRLNAQLNAATNQRHQRFERVLQRLPENKFKIDLQKMYRFIETNKERNRFRSEVAGPMAMDLEFSDDIQAKIVQSCVFGPKARCVFLFADRDDFQVANNFLIEQRLSVTIIDTSALGRAIRPSPLSPQQLKQIGASGFVMDLIQDAPDIVKIFLSQRAFLTHTLYGPEAAIGSKLSQARQMSNDTIQMGIGVQTRGGRGPSDAVCTIHKVVVRGKNIGFEQSSAYENTFFLVGRQAETDTSALQARIDGLKDEVAAAQNQEEAAGNRMRTIRPKLKEIDEKLREPQDLEASIRHLQRRHKEKVDMLKELQSVEQMEQVVSQHLATLKKKVGTFVQSYAAAADVQPQVHVDLMQMYQCGILSRRKIAGTCLWDGCRVLCAVCVRREKERMRRGRSCHSGR